jgi:hypothetical protein
VKLAGVAASGRTQWSPALRLLEQATGKANRRNPVLYLHGFTFRPNSACSGLLRADLGRTRSTKLARRSGPRFRLHRRWSPSTTDLGKLRHRRVRVIRDYGMMDRNEAPQFYPEVKRRTAWQPNEYGLPSALQQVWVLDRRRWVMRRTHRKQSSPHHANDQTFFGECENFADAR